MNVLKFVILLFLFAAFIFLLLEILRHDFQRPAWRWIWIAAITFVPVIGMVAYYFVGRRMIVKP